MRDDLSFAERRLKMTREALQGAIAVDAPAGVIDELEAKRDEFTQKVMNDSRPEPRDDRREASGNVEYHERGDGQPTTAWRRAKRSNRV
ncbi:hypothetical protein [Natrialba taiwanensis]|uniref:Uncharacterized protein n=1 Tax=Natrialba taiwanensis DSM 12281 TaxID=1230458 RepID=M0AD06_9EURY|nr:hypothetical protein [Natrialba taiwanensis]ELY96625.1 hypothetical protein C484_00785 [Natrialba taiwanensis DSM 12281]